MDNEISPKNASTSGVYPTLLLIVCSTIIILSMLFVYVFVGTSAQNFHDSAEWVRTIITLLFGVGSIDVILLLVLISLFSPYDDQSTEKRFARVKDILNTLIALLGTIIGFYFGQLHK